MGKKFHSTHLDWPTGLYLGYAFSTVASPEAIEEKARPPCRGARLVIDGCQIAAAGQLRSVINNDRVFKSDSAARIDGIYATASYLGTRIGESEST